MDATAARAEVEAVVDWDEASLREPDSRGRLSPHHHFFLGGCDVIAAGFVKLPGHSVQQSGNGEHS